MLCVLLSSTCIVCRTFIPSVLVCTHILHGNQFVHIFLGDGVEEVDGHIPGFPRAKQNCNHRSCMYIVLLVDPLPDCSFG